MLLYTLCWPLGTFLEEGNYARDEVTSFCDVTVELFKESLFFKATLWGHKDLIVLGEV